MKSVTKLVFPFRLVHTLNEGFIKCVLQSPLVDLEGAQGTDGPPSPICFHFYAVFSKHYAKQECISVGCVPPQQ